MGLTLGSIRTKARRWRYHLIGWRHHFPIQSQWECSRANNSVAKSRKVRSGPNSNSSEILCLSSLHASLTKIRLKVTEKTRRHRFSHYMSMGAFCCHGVVTTVWIRSAPPPPPPKMLLIKFEKIGQLVLEIYLFESVDDGELKRYILL